MLADGLVQSIVSTPFIIFLVGGAIAIVAIICGTVSHVLVRRSKERTKRDIAAYVAEGSIDPDKAVAMLKAGNKDEDTD
jgi:hypothetical protein